MMTVSTMKKLEIDVSALGEIKCTLSFEIIIL